MVGVRKNPDTRKHCAPVDQEDGTRIICNPKEPNVFESIQFVVIR